MNSAMMAGGMRPFDSRYKDGGKVTLGSDARYTKLLFVVAVGVVLASDLRRMLDKFHCT